MLAVRIDSLVFWIASRFGMAGFGGFGLVVVGGC